jgi:outer membrane protein assembly factor BamB
LNPVDTGMARHGELVIRTGAIGRGPMALAAALLGLLMVSACSEPEIILPGERQGLREVMQDAEIEPRSENLSRPIALGAATSNSEWAQFWGTQAFRTSHPALRSTPQLVWSADIGAGNSRRQRIVADPVVGGGRIFTLDAAQLVTATSTSGQTLWRRSLAPARDRSGDATGGGIAYADGRIYVAVGYGLLAAIDAASGQLIWTQELGATGSGAPSVRGDLVYLTAGDDTGWALDTDTGRIRWQIGTASSIGNVLGAPAPVLTDDLAIFAFGSGEIQAVFRRGGLRRWDAAVVGQRRGYASADIGDITGPPVVDGTRAYVGNQSGRIVAVSVGNGERIWTAQEGAAGPVWPAGDSVFVVTDRNELLRLSKEDGSRIWGVDLPNFVKARPRRQAAIFAHFGPIVAGGRVILASSDGFLRSFDPTNGALLYSTEIPGGAATSPAFAGGTLYVVNARGQLLAYR